MSSVFKKRLSRLSGLLKQSHPTASLVISSAKVINQGSYEVPFAQNSNFYYLTGINMPGPVLCLRSKDKDAILFVPAVSEHDLIWKGEGENFKRLASKLGITHEVTTDMQKSLMDAVKDSDELFYDNKPDCASYKLVKKIMSIAPNRAYLKPVCFKHLDSLLLPMRLKKDKQELTLIKEAITVTDESLQAIIPLIKPGLTEIEIARQLELEFMSRGAIPAFNTIIATGKSAAFLHYSPGTKKLKRGESLLIDCGAKKQMYSADISRVYPVSAKFSPLQQDIHDIVLSAQLAVLKRIKAGTKLKVLASVAEKVLTQGLKDLGVLKGSLDSLLAKKAFKPYYPHSIGHSLGLDVHDIQHGLSVLEKGMVLTVEPGLYFRKAVAKIPACGMRIEDDILVTDKGYTNLSSKIAK